MTQSEKVLQHIETYGSFTPAKCANREINGLWFGSEIGRVCRKLREKGTLVSERDGKYEVFKFSPIGNELSDIWSKEELERREKEYHNPTLL